MIPDEIWNIPEGFATLLEAIATGLAGILVIVGSIVAWRSVQQQIKSAEGLDRASKDYDRSSLRAGFTAEMLVYSRGVIEATSYWNQRIHSEPGISVNTGWPVLQDPLFYRANISRIGVLPQEWAIGALIGFYTNVLELNDQAREALAGRQTVNTTSESVAARLQLMAAQLSQALDGLNKDRKFPLTAEINLQRLFMPSGRPLNEAIVIPANLQEVLLRLAGLTHLGPEK